MRMLDMPADVPNSSETVRTTDWFAGSENLAGLVTADPEISWPAEFKALIVRFATRDDGLMICTWFSNDGSTPVQYRSFVIIRELPGWTRSSSSAYRGIALAAELEAGTAAPIGARLTSMLGCRVASGPTTFTENLMSNDSITSSLFPA